MRASIYSELASSLESDRPVALITVVGGPGLGRQLLVWPSGECLGDLGSPRLDQRAALFAEQALPSGPSRRKSFDGEGGRVDLFIEIHPPAPELVAVGAVHVAIPLVRMARLMGYRTVVIDPRAGLATRERFPEADAIICAWPDEALKEMALDERTSLAMLSHDPKIDLPALEVALGSRAGYIGALGSKKTHQKRVAALERRGWSSEQIDRIRSPIGLDLGGRRAEEIALAILAEVVAQRHGRAGRA